MPLNQEQYCLIKYSDINGLLPRGFVDKFYFAGRPIKIQPKEELFVTDEKLATVYDSLVANRIVQAIVFDKYEFKIIATEDYNVELMKYADQINIYDYAKKLQYIPVVEDVAKSMIPGTNFFEITVTFYDKNPENYFNGLPVVNHLRSDSLLTRGKLPNDLTKIELIPDNHVTWVDTYTFYSPFYLQKFNPVKENNQDSDLNGRKYNTRLTLKKTKQLLAYLNEGDAETMEFYGNLCNTYTGNMKITEPGGGSPVILETPEISIEQVKNAIDLYKCTIKIINYISNNLTYST
jgi:hypothetical protein